MKQVAQKLKTVRIEKQHVYLATKYLFNQIITAFLTTLLFSIFLFLVIMGFLLEMTLHLGQTSGLL